VLLRLSNNKDFIMRNNFKELEKLELEEVRMNKDLIQNGISSDMGFIRYMSSIVEMYFPKVLEMFVTLGGGSTEVEQNSLKRTNKYPDLN